MIVFPIHDKLKKRNRKRPPPIPRKAKSMNPKKLTLLGLYSALALAIYAAESLLPPPAPIPGLKLGLANIITLTVLQKDTTRDAGLVLLVRILLSALLFGQAVGLLYSLSGGLFSWAVMTLVNHFLTGHYPVITGIFGGIAHNVGQIAMAVLLTGTFGVLLYLPYLILGGIVAGAFTGLCARFLQKYLRLAGH